MVISFTGAQSTGKSTLLKAIQLDERFRKFNFVPEITRSLVKKSIS
jgi:nicotinamide riboside kinase